MIQFEYTKDGYTYKKVGKREARKLYGQGITIFLLPYKMRFDNMWMSPMPIDKQNGDGDFDKLVDGYTYYNCNNELGTYCAYYVQLNYKN